MATKVQVTRPTKMELARLKRRLKLAIRIQKIVKDRLSLLIMEFLQTVRECAVVREKLLTEFYEAYKAFSIASGYHGEVILEKAIAFTNMNLQITAGTRNVAGVKLPIFEIEKTDPHGSKNRNLSDGSSILDYSIERSQKCLETIIQLTELQTSLELLGAEINKVKRTNNALEYIVIPSLDETIRYLNMKFEERDREETARLKYVKRLLEQKEAYAY
ncbi:MAG: V-type ATP synthase subunit D [Syntrophales bacterium]|jgi:V/A-type H+-transporting ATPase subunit D|nr:V-type ATP synthase subunit D [Syntrophales bacterium]